MTWTYEQAWAALLPVYRAAAATGTMPFYRNWQRPPYDSVRGKSLGGPTVFFFDGSPLPQALWLGPDLALEPPDPVGWQVIFSNGPEDITLIPLFRDQPRPGPWKPEPWPDADDFLDGLGYAVQPGEALTVEGRLLRVSAILDAQDALAAAIRLCCHNEWRRRDGRGTCGAELLFALVACELGLVTTNLQPLPELRNALATAKAEDLAADGLLAATMAERLLAEALGEEAQKIYRAKLAEPPASGENTLETE